MASESTAVRCCIVGGGPAGLMAGVLLAKAGVDVLVLEKHADFLRDFRGDTIHPSTLEVMAELGILDGLLRLPHQEVRELHASVGGTPFAVADFSHLPTRCRFIALMPQWDFLDFLAGHARERYPRFALWMRAEVTDLLEEGGRVAGVRAVTPDGAREVRAGLVTAADGRHSVVRAKAGLAVEELGAPMDVLWFRLSRRPEDPNETMGHFESGRILVVINRGAYWQCGYVIAKGSLDDLRARGIEALRQATAELIPYARDRMGEIRSFEDLSLLTVRVDCLDRWYRPGLLCIGDAAHAMSPIGGVGINLAIQDAVAAANELAGPLAGGGLAVDHLKWVQKRREWPTYVTQRIQVMVQRRIIARVLGHRGPSRPPLALRLLARLPWLRQRAARLVGIGVRPEHVRLPAPPGR